MVWRQQRCSKPDMGTKLSEIWDSSTFMDMYDIMGRPVQFHWHTFSGNTSIQIKGEIKTFLGSMEPCDFKGRITFMSTFNDMNIEKQAICKTVSKTQERSLKVQNNGLGLERVWYRASLNKPNGA